MRCSSTSTNFGCKKNAKQRRKQLQMSRWHPSKKNLTTCSFPGLLERSCACISCFIGCCFFYISTPTKQQKETTKKAKTHHFIPILTIHPLCFYHLHGTIAIYTVQLWPWLASWWVTSVDFHGDNFSKGGPTFLGLAGNFWPAIFSYREVC